MTLHANNLKIDCNHTLDAAAVCAKLKVIAMLLAVCLYLTPEVLAAQSKSFVVCWVMPPFFLVFIYLQFILRRLFSN
jgi:hypothetical protein